MYSGAPRDFDLNSMNLAVLGFAMSVDQPMHQIYQPISVSKTEADLLKVEWGICNYNFRLNLIHNQRIYRRSLDAVKKNLLPVQFLLNL